MNRLVSIHGSYLFIFQITVDFMKKGDFSFNFLWEFVAIILLKESYDFLQSLLIMNVLENFFDEIVENMRCP